MSVVLSLFLKIKGAYEDFLVMYGEMGYTCSKHISDKSKN